MKRLAVFPGSFDPFTIGHESIVRRAMDLFDEIVIAIGTNTNKPEYFPLKKRMEWILEAFSKDTSQVSVASYNELTIEFCKSVHAKYLLRGLRTAADFEYERAIAQVNKAMYPEIESVFLLTSPEHTSVNSTIVRDILRHGGNARQFLPGDENLKNKIIHEAPLYSSK